MLFPDCSIVDYALQLGAVIKCTVDTTTGEVLGPLGAGGGPAPLSGGNAGPLGPGPRAVGLSTAHIPTIGIERGEGPAKDAKQAAIIGYVGGSLLKVQKAGPYNITQNGGGKRGKVKGFSKGSRRRFQKMMGMIEKEKRPIFVTLTYPDLFPDDLETWNKHLERLRSRLKRKGWGCLWRREFKIRQSGEVNAGRVAPHYHLLIWGASRGELIDYLPSAWYKLVGSGDERHLRAGTKIEVLKTWRGVCSYVSKYMAKEETLPGGFTIGRMWGVINRDAIPWAAMIEMTLENKVVNTFFRYMRRFAHLKIRSSLPSLTVFVDDPWRWMEAAQKS